MAITSGRSTIIYEVASLLNDQKQTDYTEEVVMPFLSLALGELNQVLMEHNVAITNETSPVYFVKAGERYLTNVPVDLIEIQELEEREAGSNGTFRPLPRREFPDSFPPTNSLQFWSWKNEHVVFNMNGANTNMEVRMNYIRRPFSGADTDDRALFFSTNGEMFLIYRTAAMCAMFVGENETRAAVLDNQAEKAMERVISISNKGKQQIMTRHRPFRYSYKMRGS